MKTRLLTTLAAVLIPLAAHAVEPALGGNCPVCLVETAKVVPGSDKHVATFDRQVYYFPSDKEKGMFAASPAKYAPALGGDCVVCRVNMGVRMPGKAEFAVIHDKRAYLFPSAKERDVFKVDAKKYEGADVVIGVHKPRAPMTTDGSSRAAAWAGVCPQVSLNRRESEGFYSILLRAWMSTFMSVFSNLRSDVHHVKRGSFQDRIGEVNADLWCLYLSVPRTEQIAITAWMLEMKIVIEIGFLADG